MSKILLLLAFAAVTQAALPAHVQGAVDTFQSMVQKTNRVFIDQFQTQDDTFLAICNGTFFAGLIPNTPGGPTFDLSGIQGCFSSFCGLAAPGGTCPGLSDFFSGGNSCPSTAATAIATNCANGCFGKFIGPLRGLLPCLLNAFQGLLNQLLQLCNGLEEPAHTACVTEIGTAFDPAAFGSSFDVTPIADSIGRLCLQNPASGAYCYAVLAGGAAQVPQGGSLISDTNCAYWASLGCCISGLNLMIGNFNGTSSCNGEVAPFNNAQLGQILHTCTVNGMPVSASNPVLADIPACAIGGQTIKFIKNTFAITGLVFSYYHDTLTSGGKALFFRALQIDLATAVGMTASQILFLSVGTFEAGTGATVLITFTIRGTSSTDTDGFGALVKLFLAGSTAPSFTAVDAFAAGGNSGIKSGTVGLDRTTSTSTTQTQTGASGVAGLSASMMVMFLAMLIAIVLRF